MMSDAMEKLHPWILSQIQCETSLCFNPSKRRLLPKWGWCHQLRANVSGQKGCCCNLRGTVRPPHSVVNSVHNGFGGNNILFCCRKLHPASFLLLVQLLLTKLKTVMRGLQGYFQIWHML